MAVSIGPRLGIDGEKNTATASTRSYNRQKPSAAR